MTSCGGMLSVIVRRSTFTSWSTIGIFQTSPGPRGGSSRRPQRKKTARSYSLKTRTNPSTTSILPLPAYREPEAVHGLDLDALARDEVGVVGGLRLPEGPVDEDEAGGAHLASLPDHRLHAGLHRLPSRRERLPGGEDPEGADGAAYPEHEPLVDAVRRGLVLEEQREPEAE